jgi:hypothetical protein
MSTAGKRLKHVYGGFAVILVGAALGLVSAWLALNAEGRWGTVRNGPWRSLIEAGSPDANPYVRAVVAVDALLALDKQETLYFTAATDDDGNALRGECDYRISGSDLAARWWSITAYGADRYLIKNAARRYSYNLANLAHDTPGRFEISLAPAEHPGNWLPSGGEGAIFLALRLYNPAASLADEPAHAALPSIRKERCP